MITVQKCLVCQTNFTRIDESLGPFGPRFKVCCRECAAAGGWCDSEFAAIMCWNQLMRLPKMHSGETTANPPLTDQQMFELVKIAAGTSDEMISKAALALVGRQLSKDHP